MIVLVCGGRDYRNKEELFSQLYTYHYNCTIITLLINGGVPGADTLSTMWAHENNIPFKEFHPDWRNLEALGAVIKQGRFELYNAMAGFDRNQKMIDEGKPKLVMAFPGGRGTADMVSRARKACIAVLEILED